ncbi:hypothetical protein [Nonlabens xiamenensis]|uniref:hypothetical protein n=1 Tax=Nonlabens xiamenensis TaxID=2341043 RepID=UPI000F6136B5|nr:hypothetical protein [Nonlabens xiamenensis]
MELLFQNLCQVLKPKLPLIEDSMQYVQVGEYSLALEFISDWCVDANPEVRLTSSELMKIKEVGHEVNRTDIWIELLPLLIDSEEEVFPLIELDNAQAYVEAQLISNPVRAKWLSRVKKKIETIKKSE